MKKDYIEKHLERLYKKRDSVREDIIDLKIEIDNRNTQLETNKWVQTIVGLEIEFYENLEQ
jgi:hypothetical protein